MRAPLAVLTIAALLPLAGCIDDAGPGVDLPDAGDAKEAAKQAAYAEIRELLADVPCEAEVGDGTSANLMDLALEDFVDVFEEPAGTASLDFKGDTMIAATNGLAVLDISNPLDPQVLGAYTDAGGYGDVKLSPDGLTAVGGNGGRILLIDIRDPENLAVVGEWALTEAGRPDEGTLNAHMLYTARIADKDWVFVAANNNDGVWILEMTGTPDARELTFVTSTLPVEGGPLGPHDMWVNYDAKTEEWLLYSADGYHGWAVFNIDDPANPELVGGLVRPESGYTHTIQGAWIGEKRIVATIAEVGFNVLEVYDATNLMAPVLLATWHVNRDSMVPQPAAPQHEFNIVDGKLYLGHYANGAYVFDLTTITTPVAGTADLVPVAHYANGTPTPGGLFSDIWSVDVINGVLYISDMDEGIHVVGYGCNVAGNTLLTSTG